MRCPSCGAENREGAHFCQQCAEPLPVGPSGPAYVCPNCGAQVLSSKNFCLACGASLGRARPSATRPVHPAAPPARSMPPTQQRPPLWSPPPTQGIPPPPPSPYAAPPLSQPKRGGRGCVWALIAGGVLAALTFIALVVLIFLWFYFMPR